MARIVTGIVLAMSWLFLLFWGSFALFSIIVVAIAVVAQHEYLSMALTRKEKRYLPLMMVSGLLPVFAVTFGGVAVLPGAVFLSLLIVLGTVLISYAALEDAFGFLGRLWFGVFYVGFCASHFILVRQLPQGPQWLLFLSAITVFSDSGAYYTGRLFGKTKLSPALSPGKTREGAAGGIIAGSAAGMTIAFYFFPHLNVFVVGLLGVVLSMIGIAGDLAESMIKRSFNVKDSGRLLPGHGGVLDRCDSLLLVTPVLYYMMYFALPFVIQAK